MQRIGVCPCLAWEDNRLCGQCARVVSVSHAIDRVRLGVAHLCTEHEVDIVYAVECLDKLCHSLPCPLAVVIFCGLVHATFGQEALLHTVGTHILGKQFLLTHSVCVLVGILAKRVGIFLQTKLCGKFEIVGRTQLGIENSHHRAVAALAVGIGTFLEDVEVERRVFLALHVCIVVVVAVLVVWGKVGVSQTRVVYRICKSVAVSEIRVLLALVGINRSTHLEHLVHLIVGLEGNVVSGVAYTLDSALLVVVAYRCIVVALVATTRYAHVVLLCKSVAEENVVPVGVGVAQLVNLVLSRLAQCVPTASLVGIGLAESVEYACNATLVLTIYIVGSQESKLQVDLLVAVQQVEAVDACLRHVCQLAREVDKRFARTSLLGSDDDNAVGGSCTIDGGSGSILKYGDVVDVRRIQASDRCLVDVVDILKVLHTWYVGTVHRYTVEHPQRLLGTIERGGTADANLNRCTRCASRGDRRKTGNLSSQSLVDVVHGTYLLLVNLQSGNCRC